MHFFTEPVLLNTQTASNVFGPVDGHESTQYNISSEHTVSFGAKVFACQESMMIVQPYVDVLTGTESATLVNLILKPTGGLDIHFPSVKYYIYRGVDRASLVVGTAITPDSTATKTDFIKRFWINWNGFKTNTNQPLLDDPTPESFGYEMPHPPLLPVATTTLVDEIFNSKESANTQINDLQAIRVGEGEWIADISTGSVFNFEIITDTDHLAIDLAYVRKSKNVIDVTPFGTSGFDYVSEREKVLNYIDPAAFFGMHYTIGVGTSTYTSGTQTIVKKSTDDLYNDVLVWFKNKNRVYIDIRSEKGYSYNYYENYRLDVFDSSGLVFIEYMKIKTQSQTNFYYADFLTDNWPISNTDEFIVYLTPGEKIEIQLRVDDNTQPLLFAENPKLFGSKNTNNFKKEDELIDLGALDPLEWTKTVTIETPVVGILPMVDYVAHHIRLQYFRQKEEATSPNTVLKAAHFLDGAFGGMHLPALDIPNVFQHFENTKRLFVKGSNFAFVADNGVYQDSTQLLFYAENAFSFQASGDPPYPKFDITTKTLTEIDGGVLRRENVIFNKFQLSDAGTLVDSLEIVGYNRTYLETTPKENLLLLGLTKAEHDILDALAGISDMHHKYFVFEEIPNQEDSITHVPFKKFKLKVQGLNSTGIVTVVAPSTDIFVYGSSVYMLCTKDFGAAATVPPSMPDPGTIQEFDFFHRFDYDQNDALVTSLFTGGVITVPDNTTPPSNRKVGLIGEIFYPVENALTDVLHPAKPSYPLIVLSHANGGRYTDYRDLGGFLAKNGFIVAVLNSMQYIGNDNFSLVNGTVAATVLDFITPFPANYYVASDPENLDTIYVYNNDPGPPISTDYEYQKLTVLVGTRNITTSPNTFTISSAHLLSWTKGSEFDIGLDLGGDPDELDFLISIGFHGMNPLARANIIYAHLQIIKEKFGIAVEDNFGLIGHSRGGEAVVRATKDILTVPQFDITLPGTRVAPLWKNVPTSFQVKALISLAPTDIWTMENLTQDVPYYVLYGSMDGDVSGYMKLAAPNRNSGFSLYDRAVNNTEKSMSFAYGATHNGFITNNHDYDETLFVKFKPELMTTAVQQKITQGYMNAFFRLHLKSETIWRSLFYGDYIPLSIQTQKLYHQYKNMYASQSDTVLNFEGGGSIGMGVGQVSLNAGIANLQEGSIITNDKQTPNDTKGLLVSWSSSGKLAFNVSATGKDVTAFDFLSFRIGHVAQVTGSAPLSATFEATALTPAYLRRDAAHPSDLTDYNIPYDAVVNAAYSSLVDLKVKLVDIAGIGDAFERPVDKLIPEPHFRENRMNYNFPKSTDDMGTPDPLDDSITFTAQNLTKSSMITIRIPLADFDTQGVDLTKVKELVIVFPSAGSGKVIIDDVEFTN